MVRPARHGHEILSRSAAAQTVITCVVVTHVSRVEVLDGNRAVELLRRRARRRPRDARLARARGGVLGGLLLRFMLGGLLRRAP